MTEATAAAPRASFAEDFVDIFYAPSAVFARRRGASPWPVILVVTGLFAVVSYIAFTLLGPVVQAEISRQLAQVPADQRGAAQGFARVMMLVGAIVVVPVSTLVMGLVLWLVGKMFDAEQPLSAAFLVVAFSWMPRILESLLGSLQAFVLDVNTMPSLAAASLSPARFLDPANTPPGVAELLMRLGPFVIWSYVLLAIGLKVTGRVSGSKAAVAGVVLWVIGTIPTLFAFLRGSPAGGG